MCGRSSDSLRPVNEDDAMAARSMLVLLLAAAYDGSSLAAAQCNNVTALAARVDALLAEYPRGVRPEGPLGGALTVEIGLNVRHANVDEKASTVRLIADLSLSWMDNRLQWNASEWGCAVALVDAERLWLPDVELDSTGVQGGSGGRELRARLAQGRVLWARRLDVSVPVPLDLTRWPRDTQTAMFQFASRQYTVEEFDLAIMDIEYSTVYESGGWEAAALSVGHLLPLVPGKRRVALWALALRRRGAVRAAAGGAALATAAILLVAAGMQPPAQRATLAVAASLVASVWLLSVSSALGSAGSPPHIVVAGGGAAVLGALLAAGAAIVLAVGRRDQPPPQGLRTLLLRVAGICRLTLDQPGDSGGTANGTWRALAALLDRILLACGALVLLVLYAMAIC